MFNFLINVNRIDYAILMISRNFRTNFNFLHPQAKSDDYIKTLEKKQRETQKVSDKIDQESSKTAQFVDINMK